MTTGSILDHKRAFAFGALGAFYWVLGNDAPDAIKAFAAKLAQAGYPVLTCDGTADDVQIQAAINAVNTGGIGGRIEFYGSFAISNTITMYSDIAYIGHNATWTLDNSVNKVMVSLSGTTDNVLIQGIKFDGNRANQTTDQISADPATWCDIISRTTAATRTNIRIIGCEFTNYLCYAINADGYDGCLIQSCKFTAGGVSAIRIHGGDSVNVQACYFNIVNPTNISDKLVCSAIVIDGRSNIIHGNYIYIDNTPSTFASRNFHGVWITSDGTSKIEDNIIEDNEIIGGSQQEYGVNFANAGYTYKNVIKNNRIHNMSYGINTCGYDATINDNYFSTIASRAVALGSTDAGTNIIGNRLAASRGVHLFNATYIEVSSNTFDCSSECVFETGTSNWNIVTNNYFISGTEFTRTGTNTKVRDNFDYVDPTELRYPLNNATSNGLYYGSTFTGTAGVDVAYGQPFYMATDGECYLASGTSEDTIAPLTGICCVAATDGLTLTGLHDGFINSTGWNWEPGKPIFVSPSAGELTQTELTTGQYQKAVGWGGSISTEMMVVPNINWVKVG